MPDDLDICGRCLIHVNAEFIPFTAVRKDYQESPPTWTNPHRLRKWIEEKLYGERCTFRTYDGSYDAVIAITTWHGDPVCAYHLRRLVVWEEADAGRHSHR